MSDGSVAVVPGESLREVPTHRNLAADEIWHKMVSAYQRGDLNAAKRLETHYDSILDDTNEEFEALHG